MADHVFPPVPCVNRVHENLQKRLETHLSTMSDQCVVYLTRLCMSDVVVSLTRVCMSDVVECQERDELRSGLVSISRESFRVPLN